MGARTHPVRSGALESAGPHVVLQVGEVAGVAAGLTAALTRHSSWEPRHVELSQPSGRSALARIIDLSRRAMSTRRAIRTTIMENNPAVVHLHWARYAPFVSTPGVPLIVHAHGSDVRDRGGFGGTVVRRALERAQAVVVSTPDLLAHTPRNAVYLPSPVDTDLFVPSPSSTDQADSLIRPPTVLLFAQLTAIKGAEQLVAAAAALRSERPSVRIIGIAGGTHDAQATAAGVELLTHLGRVELSRLLRSVDVVVGQQRLGALGLSELEAMACGRAVVAPIRQDLYDDPVPVIDAPDPDAIARRCIELIGDPVARAATGDRARDYVVRNHAPHVVAGLLTSLYERVCGASAAG